VAGGYLAGAMNTERPEDDPRVAEEAEAAASEAGAIGGPGADEDLDPAERASAQGGGGESEGFEQAERDLIEHASHGDPAPDPISDGQFSPEGPGDDAVHGAADHEHSTERTDEEQTQ
jgi:hypothetical protein